MTAGNLFSGFAASLLIVKGTLALETGESLIAYFNQSYFHLAIGLILIACIFDMLDGRLARLGGHESAFGREFDSLADVISFGVAPALLLYKIVLQSFDYGWIVSFLYLLCGAMRLARFNCMAATSHGADKDFRGFPIPAAAGLVASLNSHAAVSCACVSIRSALIPAAACAEMVRCAASAPRISRRYSDWPK